MTVRARLLLLILVASLVPAFVAAMQFFERRDTEVLTARQDLGAAARRVAQDVDDLASATAQLEYGLSRARDLELQDGATCSAFLAEVLQHYPQYLSILTFTPDGELLCDSLRRGTPLNVADRRYFRASLESKKSIALEPVFSRLTGDAVLTVAYAARRPSGEPKLVLVASLNLDRYIQGRVGRLPREGATLALVNGQGTVLAWLPDAGGNDKKRGTSIADSPLYQFARDSQGVHTQEIADSGLSRIWATSTLPSFPAAELHVLVGVSTQDLLAAANRSLHQALAILFVAWIAVSGAAWVLANGVMRREESEGQRIRALNETLELRVHERTAQLSASEERFRLLVADVKDYAIVMVDPQGHVVTWNEGARQLQGYDQAEILGQSMARFYLPEDVAAGNPTRLLALAARDGRVEDEGWRVRKDGTRLYVNVVLTAVRNASGDLVGFTKITRDVTARRQAEQRIRTQLEHLNLLDHITRATGERQDLKSIFQVVVRSLEDSLPIDFGCVCLYDATANALPVTSVGVKSEALAHELAMDAGALIDVDANGLSRCVQGQLVYEPDIEQVAFPFPERLARVGLRSVVMAPLKSESRVFGVLVAARREADSFSSIECEFLRQLSEHVALAAHQAQLYESLQRAYDDLRQTQAAAMQEERLRALGQMASGIAHDINNALSPVSLYTESMLGTEKNLSSGGRDKLETIQRAVEDVAQTVARMREFYRKREEQVELAPVDANQLVHQVLDLTRARWRDMALQRGATIHTTTELTAALPRVMAVDSEIREALTNLVFNAVDAMPEGGTLTLRTRFAGSAPHQSVIVEVVDSGIGMDEDTRKRCLEPFFTTKGERGTGLGLAMVFGMVQRHNAEIQIDSAPGAGTTIRLLFPVPTAAIVSSGQAMAALEPPRNLRLLLVDDDPVLLKSLRDALETDGHSVVATNGGQAGITEFQASHDRGNRYAAVITDLGMPYVDGRKVAAAVKAASPATPLILLTGWGQRLIAEGDVPAHVDAVLAKPPKLRELRETLARLCCSSPMGTDA